jgi:hypothetical protein
MIDADPPAGFITFMVDGTLVVCAEHVEQATCEALEAGSLFRFAECDPGAKRLAGRGVVYAVALPGDVERVVIRRNRHGGKFGRFTRDLFLPPTRAPHELETSERLRAAHVPTPQMLGYAIYPAVGVFRRADVMTRLVPWSMDLSASLLSDEMPVRRAALRATAVLVRALSEAGARHMDLNVKNVLLHEVRGGGLEALVLDVDRVSYPRGTDVREQNLDRLLRSARKWQTEHGARVTDAELDGFAAAVRQPGAAPSSTLS